jgi:hypothetical protein
VWFLNEVRNPTSFFGEGLKLATLYRSAGLQPARGARAREVRSPVAAWVLSQSILDVEGDPARASASPNRRERDQDCGVPGEKGEGGRGNGPTRGEVPASRCSLPRPRRTGLVPVPAAPPRAPPLSPLPLRAPRRLPLSDAALAPPGPGGRLFVNETLSFSMERRGARADAARAVSRGGGAVSSLPPSSPPSGRRGF